MSAAHRLAGRLLAFEVALVLAGAAPAKADAPRFEDKPALARCLGRIALFDQIIISRFDYRLLAIEPRQLRDAQALRFRAQADCEAGLLWFGINNIERALILIGIPPSFETDRIGPGSRAP